MSSPLAIQQAHCRRPPPDRVAVVSLQARHLPRRSCRGSVTIDGDGGRERTPLLKARRGASTAWSSVDGNRCPPHPSSHLRRRPISFSPPPPPPPSWLIVMCVFHYFPQGSSCRLRRRPPPGRNPSAQRAKGTCDDAHARTPAEGRRKNTMIYIFLGFARYCIARRAKLKNRPT